jgi:hypothetical protein
MLHTVLNLATDSNGCYPLVTAENAKSLRQSMTFRLFASNPDSFMKTYVVDKRSPETVSESPARYPNSRPVRQTRQISRLADETPKSGSNKPGTKKSVVNEALLDLTRGSVPSEIKVRGWEVEQPAKMIRITSIDSSMSMIIVKALQKEDHVIKRWNTYLTYQLLPNSTLEWHCVVLAVGVFTFPEKTNGKAFALVALRSLIDENIADWTAPSWIGGNRLLPHVNFFTTGATTKVNRPKRFDTDAKVDALLKQGVWHEQFREHNWLTQLAGQCTAKLPAAPKFKRQKIGDEPDPGLMVVVSDTGLKLPVSPSKLQPWQQNQTSAIQILAQQMLAAQQMQQQMLAAQHSQWMQSGQQQQQMQSGQQQQMQQQMQSGQQQQQIRQGHDEDTKEELKHAREAAKVAAERVHEALMVTLKAAINPSSVASVTIVPAADLSPAAPKPPSTEEVISAWLKLNGIAYAADVVTALIELGVEEGEDVLILAHEQWKACGFRDVPLVKLQRLKEKR